MITDTHDKSSNKIRREPFYPEINSCFVTISCPSPFSHPGYACPEHWIPGTWHLCPLLGTIQWSRIKINISKENDGRRHIVLAPQRVHACLEVPFQTPIRKYSPVIRWHGRIGIFHHWIHSWTIVWNGTSKLSFEVFQNFRNCDIKNLSTLSQDWVKTSLCVEKSLHFYTWLHRKIQVTWLTLSHVIDKNEHAGWIISRTGPESNEQTAVCW